MKIAIERAELLKVLGHIQSVVERRNTIPILSNVMITAADGRVTMTATDLDLEVTETVAANIEAPGSTTVSAHTFHDIIRKMPDGAQIHMNVADRRMTVTAGRARFTLPVIPPDEFPLIVAGELPTQFSMPADDLAGLLRRARFAMSTEETRYYLNGIFIHVVDDNMFAAATDGHRLARIKIACPQGAKDMPDIIIPRKCVTELLKIIDDIEDDVLISLSASKIRLEMGNIVFVSKLVDGTFPDYNRVIPSQNDKIILADAREFAQAIDRVATIATERTRSVKLDISSGKITCQVTSVEAGVAVEELGVDYQGQPIEIGFNASYLLDILNQNKEGSIELALDNPGGPALLTPKGDEEAIFVLMPMRV